MMRRVPPRVFLGEDDRKGSSCYSRLVIIICPRAAGHGTRSPDANQIKDCRVAGDGQLAGKKRLAGIVASDPRTKREPGSWPASAYNGGKGRPGARGGPARGPARRGVRVSAHSNCGKQKYTWCAVLFLAQLETLLYPTQQRTRKWPYTTCTHHMER